VYCDLEIDYEVNGKKLPTQTYHIAFDIYKEKEHFPLKLVQQKTKEIWDKLPPWAQTLLGTVVSNAIIFSLKQTPGVGPLFGIILTNSSSTQ